MPVQIKPMTTAEVLALPPTFSPVVAGRAFGFGEKKTYALLRAEKFPVRVRLLGGSRVVTIGDLLDGLGLDQSLLLKAG